MTTIIGNTSLTTSYSSNTSGSVSAITAWATPAYGGGMYVRSESDFRELERKLKAEKERAESLEIEITQIKIKYTQKKPAPTVKRILKNGDYMTVLWEDGTKTIVKRAEDEPASDYAAFTAALGIKVFGTNSELKRLVATAKEQGRKKKPQKDSMSEFDKAGRAACESLRRLGEALKKVKDAERSEDAEHTEGKGD